MTVEYLDVDIIDYEGYTLAISPKHDAHVAAYYRWCAWIDEMCDGVAELPL